MSELTRDGTAEPVSRDQILRRERGQGEGKKVLFRVELTKQDWQPYPGGPYTAICDDHTSWRMSELTERDDRTRLVRPNSQARTGTGKYFIFFPVKLTTKRIDNYTELVDTQSSASADHAYISSCLYISLLEPLCCIIP